jgi:hypothetical protein
MCAAAMKGESGGMQTIVSFYRALIWLAFVVTLLVTGLIVSAGFNSSEPDSIFGSLSIVMGLAIVVAVVITLGAAATLVSINDRLTEIVRLLDRD